MSTGAGPAATSPVWLVAVDDDPTGCQAVSGVPLLTAWDDETLGLAAKQQAPVTFVLTNSRAMSEADAVRANAEVGAALHRTALAHGLRLRLISRSDSTLRGHFPSEVLALASAAQIVPDAVVLCPAFFEAGRFTAGGIQWVRRGVDVVAARDTEFARDATFGFTELTLADWARARGLGGDVVEVTLEELSLGEVESLAAKLQAVAGGQVVVVNALDDSHLRAFDEAARRAEDSGSTFVYRSGPSFVRAAARLGPPALADLAGTAGPGLVVVGSHTELTNAQVQRAIELHGLSLVELDVASVLDASRAASHVTATVAAVAAALRRGSVVLRSSRAIADDPSRSTLEVGRAIAEALTATVRRATTESRPGWVIAKGGITSHSLLTGAFDVRRAEVRGQALPGLMSVLDIGVGGRPTTFVIFPGNVGDQDSLVHILDRFTAQ